MLNILKTQKKIAKFLESIGRDRNQSPSINQMTMVMLVYRKEADSIADLADKMDKPYDSARKLSHSLREGCAKKRTGFKFFRAEPIYNRHSSGIPRNKMVLTPEGKKFARIIAKAFGD